MRQFTIELDDITCQWLEHIAELTGKPIEGIITNGIYNQIINLEDAAFKSFSYSERE
jgi:predicted transcriptional regulator